MKKSVNYRYRLNNQKGGLVLTGFISLLLGTAAVLGIFHAGINNWSEYNRLHRIAQEVAADPNSHTDTEITNAGEELYAMMRDTVDNSTISGNTGGGTGVSMLIQAEDALRKVRQQQYIIRISPNPANPAPYQSVKVTLEIINSITGTSVTYSLKGTDGYTQNGTLSTNENGIVQFTVPGGGQSVSDTFTVTVGTVTESYTYVFI